MSSATDTRPRKRPVQARSKATVTAILDATARVLVEEGFERASTNRIATVAGVSIGSLYQYFPHKDALIQALLERHVRASIRAVSDELEAAAGLPLRDAARRIVDVMLRMHAVDPALHRVLMEQAPHTDGADEVERRVRELARAYLELHRDQIRPRNLDLAAFICVQAIESLTHGAVLYYPERLTDDEFAEEATELIVRYLQK